MRFDGIKALLVAVSLAQCPLSLIYTASTNTGIRKFVDTPTKEKQSSTARQRSAIDNNNDSKITVFSSLDFLVLFTIKSISRIIIVLDA